MNLVAEKRFKKAFKRLIKKNPQLRDKILSVLDLLEIDPFSPALKSHKLTGNLANCWSCSVSYDCRIVFTFSKDTDSDNVVIILIDIGSHDEVY
jgi:addiction module RelE/StbE family toxin